MLDALKALWKNERLFLSVMFALALALRLGYLAWSKGAPEFPDEADYRRLAEPIRASGMHPSSDMTRPPLYPQILAHLPRWDSDCFGDDCAPLVLNALLGAFSVVLLARLTIRFPDSSATGRLSALLLAFHPFLVFFSAHTLIESALVTLMLGQLVMLDAAAHTRTDLGLLLWLCGLAVAGWLASLTTFLHAGHLGFAVLGAPLAGALLAAGRRPDRAKTHWRWAVFFFGASMWSGGFVIRSEQQWKQIIRVSVEAGGFVPVTTKLGTDLYEAFGPEATGRTRKDKIAWPPEGHPGMSEVERDLQLRRLAWDCIKDDPARAVWLGVKKVAYTWNPFPNWEGAAKWYYWVASGVVCLPIILGALLSPFILRGVPRRTLAILWAPILYYTALHFVFVGSVRYRMAFEPCLIVLAAATWVAVWNRARGTGRSPAPGQ